MSRLLPLTLATLGVGLSLAACTPRNDEAPAPSAASPSAAAPQAPAPATAAPAVTAPASPALAPTPAPPQPVVVRRATRAEEALVADASPRPHRAYERADEQEQEDADHERDEQAEEEAERAREKRAVIARFGHYVPEANAEEEREEKARNGMTGADERAEYERRIRAPVGGEPQYASGYRTVAAEALDSSPLSKAMRTQPMQAMGITAITEHGPGNVSGRTRAISPDPASPLDTWLVAGVDGGFWKTSNAGASWTHVAPNLDYLAFTAIGRSPRDPNVLYAGTGEGFGNIDAVRGDGIFRSTDRGDTWTLLPSTNRFNGFAYTNRVVVFGTTQDTVIAATNNGVYRSTNNGTTWTLVYQPLSGTTPRQIQQVISNPLRPRTLYAAVSGLGVARSGNGGTTWTAVNTGLTMGSRIEIALASQDTTHLYAQVEFGTSGRYYRSVNAGKTAMSWSRLTGTSLPNVLNQQGWYNNTLVVDPSNKNRLYVGGVDVYRLTAQPTPTNTGTTLTQQSVWYLAPTETAYAHADHHAMLMVTSGGTTRLINGSDGGVAFSDDIVSVSGTTYPTWTKTLTGYNTSQPYSADRSPTTDAFVTGLQDNGTWVSPSAPTAASAWSFTIGGDGFDTAWNQRNPNLVMGSLYFNRLFRSTNGGATFTESYNGLAEANSDALGPFITRLFRNSGDPDLLFVGGKTAPWRSDNFGGNWSKSTLDIASKWFSSASVSSSIVASPANPQIVYAGNAAYASGTYTIFRSTNGGNSFTALPTTGMTGMSHFVTNMAMHPTDPNTAYVLFSAAGVPKIFRTTDGGQTWTPLTGTVGTTDAVSTNGFPNVATYCLLQMPFDPNQIWAGTEIGLVVSTDNGATWSRPSFTFPNVAVRQMQIAGDRVVIATHGRGVWTAQFSGLATYTPPAVTLAPRFERAGQSPSGSVLLGITRPTALDSTVIFRSAGTTPTVRTMALAANTGRVENEDVRLPAGVVSARTDTFKVVGYKNGTPYYSQLRTVTVTPPTGAAPVVTYTTDPSTNNGADFTTSGVTLTTPAGFADPGFHSAHSYAINTNASLTFNAPIVVAATGATLEYDEIVLTEQGFDFVWAEATKDGSTWVTIAGPYDASSDPAWDASFGVNGPGAGDPSMFRTRTIDLLAVQAPRPAKGDGSPAAFGPQAAAFAPGDTLLIRWRFTSDSSVNGWGWALDNVKIQENGALPVELADFAGVWNDDRVRLSWRTVSETNNARFVVERANGAEWTAVGELAGAGTTTEAHTYGFDDRSLPFGMRQARYRLRQIDTDGTAHFSPELTVEIANPDRFAAYDLFPNPSSARATFRYALPADGPVRIELYDLTGRLVQRMVDGPQTAGRREVSLETAALAPGQYLLRITAGTDTATKRLTVLH